MPLLTPKEAAAELGISVDQLRRLSRDGAIAFINVGRGTRVPTPRYDPQDLETFKAARRTLEIATSITPRRGVPKPKSQTVDWIADVVELRRRQEAGERIYPRRPKPGPARRQPLPGYKPK